MEDIRLCSETKRPATNLAHVKLCTDCRLRNAVYDLIYDFFGAADACRFQLWMALKDSGRTMAYVARRLGVRVQQVWALFDAEKDPMFSTLALLAKAVGCRLEIELI